MSKARKLAPSDDKLLSLPPNRLYYDSENPRLTELDITDELSGPEMTRVLWRDMAVKEVLMSITANGYFRHEPLLAIEKGADTYTVIEGNRRLAAVKLIVNPSLARELGVEVPKMKAVHKRTLQEIPTVLTTRETVWQYIGFKHVNGSRPWSADAKAEYIARVHNQFNVELPEIAKEIGDSHSTVTRLYRGLMVQKQATNFGVYDLQDRWHKKLYFSHLYTGLGYSGIRQFLGLRENMRYKLSPVPKDHKRQLGDLMMWLYGSKSKNRRPLIRSQNPDLRLLDEALQTDRGRASLEAGLPIEVAHDAGRGDDNILREALASAKVSTQKAFGVVHTGYDGKSDTYEMAEGIYSVAGKLVDVMEEIRIKPRKQPKKRSRGSRRT